MTCLCDRGAVFTGFDRSDNARSALAYEILTTLVWYLPFKVAVHGVIQTLKVFWLSDTSTLKPLKK